jgi:ACR3 family arsenite transporter
MMGGVSALRAESDKAVLRGLSVLDRLLPIWIFAAMGAGILIGYFFPEVGPLVDSFRLDSVSLPIAVGLIWMMYPPLAAVNYREIGKVRGAGKVMGFSLFLNWVVGPLLMFGISWVLLPDMPLFRDGLIIVGLARCIAMVLVWNMLAGGDSEYAAIIVVLNAIFQIALYSVYAYFLVTVLPRWLDPSTSATVIDVNPLDIARSVAIFLGVPLLMGFVSRLILEKMKGKKWYEDKFLRIVKPTALIGLLFTLVVMFSLKGNYIVTLPLDLVRVAIPLLTYFLIMFGMSYLSSWRMKFTYQETATISFTAASNNFELAIAVAVAVFGLNSSQAFATVVGPLIEVPVMIGLVYLSLWLKTKLYGVKISRIRLPADNGKSHGAGGH